MKTLTTVLLVAFFCISPLHAARKGIDYWAPQYSLFTYDENGFDEVGPSALTLRFGTFVDENSAIETRLGFGLQGDDLEVGSNDGEVEVDNFYGLYVVIQTSGIDDTNVYAVLGFTKVNLDASDIRIAGESNDSGLSYGIGANFRGINIEYMSYLNESDYDVTAFSLGYRHMFD